jgi:hypothetical protein
MVPQPLNDVLSAREALKHISHSSGLFRRTAEVLNLVAHSSTGLGEVLQDYAHQACSQLEGVIRAAENRMQNHPQPDDTEALQNIYFTLKAVKSVLEMTPAAMERNKAETLGEKGKLTRSDIAALAETFLQSPDVIQFLASEDSGLALAGGSGAQMVGGQDRAHAAGQ